MSNEVVPVELPRLRGFSPMNIRNMRLFFAAWNACLLRQGKIVLVELHDTADPETGGAYAIKKYQSEKADLGYGEWTHSRICQHPLNPEYKTIVIEENLDEAFTVVAEFVKVLPQDKGCQHEG